MKFTGISLDPQGVYIGQTTNGWLWRWVPQNQIWLIVWTGEEDEREPDRLN